MMPLLVEHAFPTEEMRKRARDLMAQVGLTQWETNLANNMSGGQQQRVAIARSLAMNPALILPMSRPETSIPNPPIRFSR